MAVRNFSSSVEETFFQHKRKFVSPSDHVMFCLLYKYQLYKYHSRIVYTLTKTPLPKARIIVTIRT